MTAAKRVRNRQYANRVKAHSSFLSRTIHRITSSARQTRIPFQAETWQRQSMDGWSAIIQIRRAPMPLYPEFNRMYVPGTPTSGPIRWLPLRGREVLVQADGETVILVADELEALAGAEQIVLGESNGATYVTCEVPADFALPDDWRAIDLRRLYGRVDEQEWTIAGY